MTPHPTPSPPDSSSLMLDSFQFMDESSDQDLLLDVPSNNSFPQAELLFPTSRCPPACLDGAIHFAARHRGDESARLICSFDLGDNEFKMILLPNDLANAGTEIKIRTVVFRGLLSLLCDEYFESCSIWIMKEYGVVNSWYKYVKVDLAGGIGMVIGVRNNGHILLAEGNPPPPWELSSYDPQNKEIKKLGINFTIGDHVDTYEENLILLDKTDVLVSRRGGSRKRKDRSISLPPPGIAEKTNGRFSVFGFDLRSNDYKVVRVSYRFEEAPLVQVYSLNAGSWKVSSRAGNSFPLGIRRRYTRYPPACLDGAIHFAAQRRGDQSARLICSFDLDDNVFTTISLPNDLANARTKIRTVVFRGLLSLLCEEKLDFTYYYIRSIWIMKEYGVVGSWYKYVEVDITRQIQRVIGIRNNGHILLLEGEFLEPWELSSYDPQNKEIKKLGIKGAIYHFHVDIDEENLILLDKKDVPVSRSGDSKKGKDRLERYKLGERGLVIDTEKGEDKTFRVILDVGFSLKLVGYVKGLFCFSNEKDKFFLRNLSIRRSISLPTPGIAENTYGCLSGFGFDSQSNDYKVVRVSFRFKEVPIVQVYSLNAGSWKVSSRAGNSFPLGIRLLYTGCPPACLDGAIHFAAQHRGNQSPKLICSFDLGNDMFKTMSLPNDLANARTDIRTVVFRGLLSLLCNGYLAFGDKFCSIWIMKEYGVVDSWYKYVKVDLTGGIVSVIGIQNNGHILLEKANFQQPWELSLYDPQNKEVKKLGINASMYRFHVDIDVENLILLNKTDDGGSKKGTDR
ncbi:hypothetical protein Vadar_010549 [Vaccinium darrowii]|uniref:Uncharacterized protein n=1 Tax=Vaccinium darrowii TaxID=229202 RepID=A0ACB7WZV9_9ERIC|nr:hypothetical protein Vadar_010549 [Vaccinium darrowii]